MNEAKVKAGRRGVSVSGKDRLSGCLFRCVLAYLSEYPIVHFLSARFQRIEIPLKATMPFIDKGT